MCRQGRLRDWRGREMWNKCQCQNSKKRKSKKKFVRKKVLSRIPKRWRLVSWIKEWNRAINIFFFFVMMRSACFSHILSETSIMFLSFFLINNINHVSTFNHTTCFLGVGYNIRNSFGSILFMKKNSWMRQRLFMSHGCNI